MLRPPLLTKFLSALLLSGALLAPVALAEKADRAKPMVIDADKPGTLDLQRQVVVFNGNVAITQGTLSLRAERIEVRDSKEGRTANAIGSPERQASYRQKRDVLNEWVEGSADRIEFDTRTDTLTFIGNASVRRLRGTEVADEITGNSIVWDNKADLFSVTGGVPSAANPAGRIRAVLAPRAEAAASGPAAAAAEAPPLKPARALGERK
ncbi:MAG: lipopolysaccharide transport periplasmic protein LptA [Rubrivivax sp.]|nr:lipopolysaccharide transport periplasmic protein LptA [Rubrivivax sp.]